MLQCDGVNGQHCSCHGLPFVKQLTEKQRVDAVAQVVQLNPVPYKSESLLDWCVKYLLRRQHLQPGCIIPAVPPPTPLPLSTALPAITRPSPGMAWWSTSHDMHYQGWVMSLIPALPTGGNNHGQSRV